MTQTVVAVFDKEANAKNAARRLVDTGVPLDHIDMANATVQIEEKDRDNKENKNFFDKVGDFFTSLFEDKAIAEQYSQFAQNKTIVTVHAQSTQEAAHAAQLLDEGGAVDMDQNQYVKGENLIGNKASDQTLPIDDSRLDNSSATSGVGTRSRIFNRPVFKDYRLFGMQFYYDEDNLPSDTRRGSRNY